jgi:hypothetical protein
MGNNACTLLLLSIRGSLNHLSETIRPEKPQGRPSRSLTTQKDLQSNKPFLSATQEDETMEPFHPLSACRQIKDKMTLVFIILSLMALFPHGVSSRRMDISRPVRNWRYETADSSGDVGYYASIALDNQDRPHIGYADYSNADIFYTYRSGATWLREMVAADYPTYFVSMQLDSTGAPHMIFGDGPFGSQPILVYARRTTQGWEMEGLAWRAKQYDFIQKAALALDANDTPHVVYYDDVHGQVKYGKRTSNGWIYDTVADTSVLAVNIAIDSGLAPWVIYNAMGKLYAVHHTSTGWDTMEVDGNAIACFKTIGITIDHNDHPHLSYCGNQDELKYAWYDGADWHTQTVDSGANLAQDSTITLNSTYEPHIVYSSTENSVYRLKYASRSDGVWSNEFIGDKVKNSATLALDSTDTPHSAYFDDVSNALTYGMRAAGVWTAEALHGNYPAVNDPFLVLDSQDQPRIAAGSPFNSQYYVRYAMKSPGGWSYETIAGPQANGYDLSMALDSTGTPHLSLVNGSYPDDLWYATRTGAGWQVETVDHSVNWEVGNLTSLAVDSFDRPHIGYYVQTPDYNNELRYAHLTASGWLTETVHVARYPSSVCLRLDSQDRPRIVFQDMANTVARWSGSDWLFETVGLAPFAGTVDCELDSQDQWHLTRQLNLTLFYLRQNQGTWSEEPVDESRDTGWNASLALNAQDQPQITYYERYTHIYKHATHLDSGWHVQPVAGSSSIIQPPISLALDHNGYPHFATTTGSFYGSALLLISGGELFMQTFNYFPLIIH